MTQRPEQLARYAGCDCGGEHRTLGDRAWCLDCHEYCYPDAICEVQDLRERYDDARSILRRTLPLLIRLGDFIGNGKVDPARHGSLGERCDLIADIHRVLEVQ